MTEKEAPAFIQCGRRVSAEEIEQIKETVELFPRLSLKELVATICEHLGWYTAANNLKREACMKLLRKLEAAGIVKLPEKRKVGGVQGYSPEMVVSSRTDSRVEITGTVKELRRVSLEAVQEKQEKELWNEYVFRYHGFYFFIAPNVKPRTRYFCIMIPKTIGGIAAIIPSAAFGPYSAPTSAD